MSNEPNKCGHFTAKMAAEQAKACAQIITAMSVKELRMILMTIAKENDIELASYLIEWQEVRWRKAKEELSKPFALAPSAAAEDAIKQGELLFALRFGEE